MNTEQKIAFAERRYDSYLQSKIVSEAIELTENEYHDAYEITEVKIEGYAATGNFLHINLEAIVRPEHNLQHTKGDVIETFENNYKSALSRLCEEKLREEGLWDLLDDIHADGTASNFTDLDDNDIVPNEWNPFRELALKMAEKALEHPALDDENGKRLAVFVNVDSLSDDIQKYFTDQTDSLTKPTAEIWVDKEEEAEPGGRISGHEGWVKFTALVDKDCPALKNPEWQWGFNAETGEFWTSYEEPVEDYA